MKKAWELVRKFMAARDWDKQLPDHVAKSISIEAAELLEIFQWSSPGAGELKGDPEKLAEVSSELADVLIYSLQMAILLGLDTDQVVEEKLRLAAKKYPAALMRKRSRGEPDAHERYLAIKKASRKSRETRHK